LRIDGIALRIDVVASRIEVIASRIDVFTKECDGHEFSGSHQGSSPTVGSETASARPSISSIDKEKEDE
jgi:hypothetical protein